MPSKDIALAVKKALETHWTPPVPCVPTLHVDDNYRPAEGATLLVANDGGPRVHPGAWVLSKHNDPDRPWPSDPPTYPAPPVRPMRRLALRMTAFAKGRTDARDCVDAAVDWVCAHKDLILDEYGHRALARIEDISEILLTRDRETGAFLASVIMPVIVKPIAA